MAISIYSNSGIKSYGIKHYTLDYASDLSNMPTANIKAGSTAFIIENSKYYMLNNQHQWILVNLNSGSIINSSSIEDGDTVIFDGTSPLGG